MFHSWTPWPPDAELLLHSLQAYTLREAQAVHAEAPDGSAFVAANATRWADVAAAAPIDWAAYQPPQQVGVFPLKPPRSSGQWVL